MVGEGGGGYQTKEKMMNMEIRLGKKVDEIGRGFPTGKKFDLIGFIEAQIFGSCYLGMGCKCFIKTRSSWNILSFRSLVSY